MAGGHHQSVRLDPAIERWSQMRENVYKTFRMTPKASRQVFVWGFVAPVLVAGLAWATDNTQDWAGKKQGTVLSRKVPVVEAVKDEE